jgi:integrase
MPIPGPDDDGAPLTVVQDSRAALVAVGFATGELIAAGLAVAEFGEVVVLDASRHPALVYLAGLAPGSRPTMRKALDIIARLLTGASFDKDGRLVDGIADHRSMPWQAVTYAHARAVRAELAGHYAHSTASKMLSALRGVATEAWRLGLMDGDTRARIVDVDGVKGTSIPAGRSLAGGELRALFATCAEDPTAAGRRDAAMLALAYGCGLRRSELVALDLAHYDALSATVAVVAAKGNKSRLAYPDGAIADALAAWLAVRGSQADPLFLAVNKGGRIIYGHRLSTTAVYAAASKRQVAAAGVGRFSPHDLRRTHRRRLDRCRRRHRQRAAAPRSLCG